MINIFIFTLKPMKRRKNYIYFILFFFFFCTIIISFHPIELILVLKSFENNKTNDKKYKNWKNCIIPLFIDPGFITYFVEKRFESGSLFIKNTRPKYLDLVFTFFFFLSILNLN